MDDERGMVHGGYVMIARQIRNSPLWRSLKSVHRIIMLELLLQAQWHDGAVVRNGEIIHLKRGQVCTSYQQLVDDIGDKGVTIKIVRTVLEKLEKHDFLAKDEAKARAKRGLLLTIRNYGFYQDSDNYLGKAKGKEEGIKRAKRGQSEGITRAINNKEKNLKQVKKDKEEDLKELPLSEIESGLKQIASTTITTRRTRSGKPDLPIIILDKSNTLTPEEQEEIRRMAKKLDGKEVGKT